MKSRYSRGGVFFGRSLPLWLICVLTVAFASSIDAFAKKDCAIPIEVDFDVKVDEENVTAIRPRVAQEPEDFNFKTSGAACGIGSSLLDSFTSKLTVTRGTKQFEFIPLLLTDKSKSHCYAAKVRTACFKEPSKLPNGGFEIELRASESPRSTKTIVRADSDGKLTYEANNSQFYLMTYSKPFATGLTDALQTYKCTPARPCVYDKTYFIEWQFLERLRIVRRLSIGKPEARQDLDLFYGSVGANLSGSKKVVQTFIAANEVGSTSPYELQDAVLADSGPSFGLHQIDIATNTGDDIAVFREIVSKHYETATDPNTVATRLRVQQGLYQRPIREYKTSALATLYRDWIPINAALRSDFGKKRYNAVYIKYLDKAAKQFEELARKHTYVRKYPWVGFLLVDIDNQYNGNSLSQVRFGEIASRTNSAAQFITGVRDEMLGWTYAGRGPAAYCDVQRRIRNVLLAANQHYPQNGPWPMPDVKNPRGRTCQL